MTAACQCQENVPRGYPTWSNMTGRDLTSCVAGARQDAHLRYPERIYSLSFCQSGISHQVSVLLPLPLRADFAGWPLSASVTAIVGMPLGSLTSPSCPGKNVTVSIPRKTTHADRRRRRRSLPCIPARQSAAAAARCPQGAIGGDIPISAHGGMYRASFAGDGRRPRSRSFRA